MDNVNKCIVCGGINNSNYYFEYCSKKCRNTEKCIMCGKIFMTDYFWDDWEFCSKECRNIRRKIDDMVICFSDEDYFEYLADVLLIIKMQRKFRKKRREFLKKELNNFLYDDVTNIILSYIKTNFETVLPKIVKFTNGFTKIAPI